VLREVHHPASLLVASKLARFPAGTQGPSPHLEGLATRQAEVITTAIAMLAGATPQAAAGARPLVLIVSGGPGTGKTFTVARLAAELERHGYSAVLSATTGAAASRLGASCDTLHSTVGINPKRESAPLHLLPPELQTRLFAADAVVIDEMSMLTNGVLGDFLLRAQQATAAGCAPKLVVLVGDHAQLPPVCKHSTLPEQGGVCTRCHIVFSPTWETARHVHLDVVFRSCQDAPLASFLNAARFKPPSAQALADTFAHRYIEPDTLLQHYTPGATVLCTHCSDVRAFNNAILDWHHERGLVGDPVDINGHHDVPGGAHATLQAWGAEADLTRAAVGARVVFTASVDKRRGQINSHLATIQRIDRARDGTVCTIHVALQDGRRVPVVRSVTEFYFTTAATYRRHTFPLQLAYALTAHK
jgi:hypothetical protein